MQRVGTITLGMGGYVLSSYIGSETPWLGPVEPMMYEGDQSVDGVTSDVAPDGRSYPEATDAGDVVQYGTITVRVPEAKFDDAVKRFSALGEVVDLTTSADDVSDQMVDLRARLRHARAVDRRLVGFLDDARNVRETLAVQDRIDANQLVVEQLTAEIARLSEVTSYGTITVSLHERGVPQPGSIDESDTFWGAFTNSLRLIADGAKASAVALGAALPFLALFGAVAVAVWYARRAIFAVGRRRRRRRRCRRAEREPRPAARGRRPRKPRRALGCLPPSPEGPSSAQGPPRVTLRARRASDAAWGEPRPRGGYVGRRCRRWSRIGRSAPTTAMR